MNEIPITDYTIIFHNTKLHMTVIKIYSFVEYFFSVKKLMWGYC